MKQDYGETIAQEIFYECDSYDVFETILVRINRLARIVDDEEDLIPIRTRWLDVKTVMGL